MTNIIFDDVLRELKMPDFELTAVSSDMDEDVRNKALLENKIKR
eukprot:CAMPEP_0177614762 /NCGR_PEP_ID=MMETSP0419_2-20121207/22944_1 /TAXON_ID=582737 /ORGANISM="Tetraselmis sp., Strain GSL018" /LENGTH=43 /DNA_ID= /DNA_START= /DNA_END= /DNA_ORIENTATION=